MKKVLITGDVEGNFDFLLSKIEQLSQKQSFDFCLCVGKTLSVNFNPNQFNLDNKKIPLPIYFVDTSEFSPILHTLHPNGIEVVPNLTFLGKSGIKNIQGISVAYLSGKIKDSSNPYQSQAKKFNAGYYDAEDLDNIINNQDTLSSKGIDILLTSEWPQGFDSNLPEKLSYQIKNQSFDVTNLVNTLKPRYHIVGLENFFYKRPAYSNDGKTFITRLIGIAKVPKDSNTQTKQQYIYALQLKGIEEMTQEELAVKPSDTTANPYTPENLQQSGLLASKGKDSTRLEIQKRSEKTDMAEESAPLTENIALYFQGFDRKTNDSDIYEFLARWGQIQDYQLLFEAETGKHKGCGFVLFKNLKTTETALKESGKYSLHGKRINFNKANKGVVEGGKLSQQNAECWFCLDNPNVSKELIVYVGEEFYIALDKGPISRHHVLLIPIDHHPNTLGLPLKARDEMEMLKMRIAERYEEKYNELVIFYEKHLRVTQNIAHMVLNVFPFRKQDFDEVLKNLDKRIKRYGYNTYVLRPEEKAKDMIYENEYFVYLEVINPASLRSKETWAARYLIIVDQKQLKNFPRDLGREAVCDVLECRNKINWKDAAISDKEIGERTAELKKVLNK